MPCTYDNCQFADEELLLFLGQEWCIFHLPIKASWGEEKAKAFNKRVLEFVHDVDDTGVDLSGVVFPGPIKFNGATFSETSFTGATFSGATFSGAALFPEATFSGAALFPEATFSGAASFSTEETFVGAIARQGAVLPELGLDFNYARFRDALFNGSADFTNRHFKMPTDFSGGCFAKAPAFHQCKLHQDTDFAGREFSLKFDADPTIAKREAGEAARAFRTLKLSMEEVRSRQEEAMFYALEQRARRASGELKPFPWLLSWLYDKVSDYGRREGRPLLVLLAVSMLFGCSYWFWSQKMAPFENLGLLTHPAAITNFTFDQLISPFRVWRSERVQMDSEWHLVLLLLTSLQTILSTILIALGVLAIRWRFRRG